VVILTETYRSTQPHSLSIWVHYLQNRQYIANGFKPDSCSVTISGSAVTVGGGTQMARLNDFVHKLGKAVVAGSSATVSVGGYVSGGGHGILSGKYGLAADNVLQVEMVVPSGEVVVANECQNTDLFWAVRGVRLQVLVFFNAMKKH
jgi:FAD binding domain-containing protein